VGNKCKKNKIQEIFVVSLKYKMQDIRLEPLKTIVLPIIGLRKIEISI